MTDAENLKRMSRANDLGRQSRRNGGKRVANPFRGSTPEVRAQHDEWDSGWLAQDSKLKQGRKW